MSPNTEEPAGKGRTESLYSLVEVSLTDEEYSAHIHGAQDAPGTKEPRHSKKGREEDARNNRYQFVGLRLSLAEFNEYKCDHPDMHRRPIQKPCFRYKVQVRGYGSEARRAIKMANKDLKKEGQDYFEINCWEPDPTRWIKQRIEHRLRIPEECWALAGDGLMVSQGKLAHASFAAGKKLVELLLVPAFRLREFEARKVHIWNEKPERTEVLKGYESVTILGRDKKYLYQLIVPLKAITVEWALYIEQRQVAHAHIQRLLKKDKGRPLNPWLEQIQRWRHFAVDHPLEPYLTSGIIPIKWEINRFVQPVDARMFTRIYSPTKPAIIDLYWHYHYHNRSRAEEVSFHCFFLWRVHDQVETADVYAPKFDGPTPRPGRNGWKLVFALNMNKFPDVLWKDINEKVWGLKRKDVDHIHKTLFDLGESAERQVSKIDTVQLMLSAVGIVFSVAKEESKVWDERIARKDDPRWVAPRYELGLVDEQDPLGMAITHWDMRECTGWLGAHIRRACRTRLARDDQFIKRKCGSAQADADMGDVTLENDSDRGRLPDASA